MESKYLEPNSSFVESLCFSTPSREQGWSFLTPSKRANRRRENFPKAKDTGITQRYQSPWVAKTKFVPQPDGYSAPQNAQSCADRGPGAYTSIHSQQVHEYIAAYHVLWRANALAQIHQRRPPLAPAERPQSQTRLPQSRMRIQSSRPKQMFQNPRVQQI
ncbi:hypothetical protein N7466_006462 [Penicillium verhagenii]|uniref:uncharacterized protein n=1 Tax=Penicillium verhagenii TaxID=1562060 RepID=UPI002545660A|nr:uncharacterized protein N7466_006462 [Penicillium verhagenii]KAJ5930969.1 hypothetical protein N7466_006462 [Penicillium verhagenii]